MSDAQARATADVTAVVDDPAGRLRLREAFYQRFGFGPGAGFGASELDFLRWEVRRGVLNSPQASAPGSAWWRAVNADLLTQAQCAAYLHDAGAAAAPDLPTTAWLSYLRAPSASAWYRAHNTSIVSGYLAHAGLAQQESEAEQAFMNIVLYRLLYAQSLVERSAPGLLSDLQHGHLGRLIGDLERLVADPLLPSVDVIVHLPNFYPASYPLKPEELQYVFETGHSVPDLVERLFDHVVIGSGMHQLYDEAAGWLRLPDLRGLISGRRPSYPWHALQP
jgi:hypothetical protein